MLAAFEMRKILHVWNASNEHKQLNLEWSYVRPVLCPHRSGFDLVSARGLLDRTLEIDLRKSAIVGGTAR